MFQSRNRESSNFNSCSLASPHLRTGRSFNLVIENLLISTVFIFIGKDTRIKFQSRNRESSNFNVEGVVEDKTAFMFQSRNRESSNFNSRISLPADVLRISFQSRNRESSNFNRSKRQNPRCTRTGFNLVIENLLISTLHRREGQRTAVPVSIS